MKDDLLECFAYLNEIIHDSEKIDDELYLLKENVRRIIFDKLTFKDADLQDSLEFIIPKVSFCLSALRLIESKIQLISFELEKLPNTNDEK